MVFRLKSCQKCKGDLVLDGDEWRCCQCARYYRPVPLPRQTQAEPAARVYLNDLRAGAKEAVYPSA